MSKVRQFVVPVALTVLAVVGFLVTVAPTESADLSRDSRNESPILPTDKQFDTLKRKEVQEILNRLNIRPPAD